jgi:two-component system sensor histidine kinase/response regulator
MSGKMKDKNKTKEELIKELQELRKYSNCAHSSFFANMSHEIRTPINEIIGITELLCDTHPTEQQKGYLKMIKVSSCSLLKVINDILDFSKIETKMFELDNIDFSLRHNFRKIMKICTLQAQKNKTKLIYSIQPDVPDTLVGDPCRFRQVIFNLVDNAIKFTIRGEVEVYVKVEHETDTYVALRFTVKDTGIGIPLEKQRLIFKPFTQVDNSNTRTYKGTGLGLAISKNIVEMMGGHIGVKSILGRGTIFYFTAKFGISMSQVAHVAPINAVKLDNIPILIVDDNTTNRHIFKEMLTKIKMKPVAVGGAQTALIVLNRALLQKVPFQVILIDDQMPEMDGFKLIEQIKKRPELSELKIIMLTSAGKHGDANRCRKLSVSGYLTKPIKQADLLNAIRAVLEVQPVRDGKPPLITRHYLRENRRRLRILLAEDSPVNQKIAVNFLEKWGHTVTVANNGKEAIAATEKAYFDLIIMDIHMPEMNGLEAASIIRKRKTDYYIPIVAITASSEKDGKEYYPEAGIDDYFSKPFSGEELFEIIERVMGYQHKKEYLTQLDMSDVIDKDSFLNRVNGDRELLEEVVNMFLKRCPSIMSHIEKAIQHGNSKSLEHAVYLIKSLISNFSARGAFDIALKLEAMAIHEDLTNAQEAYEALKIEMERIKRALFELLNTLTAV